MFEIDNRRDTIFHSDKLLTQMLLGFDINSKNIRGDTIFHNGNHSNKLKMAILLGFDINSKNIRGNTIFHKGHHSDKLQFAIKYGFNINCKDYHEGNTIFHRKSFK